MENKKFYAKNSKLLISYMNQPTVAFAAASTRFDPLYSEDYFLIPRGF